MRILVIGVGNPIPSFILRRLRALSKAGIELTITIENYQRVEDLPKAEFIRIGGSLSLIHQFFAFVRALLSPFLFFRLMSLQSELKFIQRLKWAVLYFPLVRVKTPDVVHFQWLASIPEYSWLRNYFSCPFMGSARGSQLTVYPNTRFSSKEKIEKAIQRADYIHCVSKDMALACERLGANTEKLIVNYNGISLTRFTPSHTTRLESATLRLISIGALIWRKGYVFQLQIIKELKDLGHSVTLNIIGSGSDEMGLRYTAHRLGIEGQVVFEGQQKEEHILVRLQSSDLYLSASAAEGLPNTLVEAAACGLPIVAFQCEGVNEVIEENRTGYIVDFGDIKEAAQKIVQLKDANKRAAMGQLAREKIEKEFDEAQWVRKMIDVYKDVSAKKKKNK
ncbi:MAG: glycosyltransferase family 4 protein [Chryseolinea sp.]